jgi:hypothetical protein
MLGHLYLRLSQNLLKVADAKLALSQQIQNSQPSEVAKALINLDESHKISSIFPLFRRIRTQIPSV